MTKVYIAVMNYNSGTIELHEPMMPKNYNDDFILEWFESKGYKDSECYYMVSEQPINVIRNI